MDEQTVSVSTQGSPVVLLILLAIGLFYLIATWKVYSKAGQPGWGCIIPFYNIYLLCKIAGKPGWWLLLFFVPVVNIVIQIIVIHGVSKNFGKGVGFTLGLIFLGFIFLPILAFGSAQYQPQS